MVAVDFQYLVYLRRYQAVIYFVRDEEAVGSSPVTSTNKRGCCSKRCGSLFYIYELFYR